ncbi:hypothetical protein J3U21_07025 [Gilliamella sp. B2776]|uniref:pectate lyase family protein n=1 Tax=unclassified Gilliamella TaxID=2685620 RepID=UPI00226A9391|nr:MULTISPECIES: hypothetical protein [unclassified Gilliamella]MCX8650225.1 hypothetical protein [Gilliamella sp. B2779]MCX8653428.1 hypothetical protein [Gilliamella sp. B2737]MCX8656283.1 hypothetical protein [Gilliamella sp. B2894]MCX8665126.1 hypothetical protein [Gilliamella sp. B2887]MCX8691904.1 hypothetical protein [Gilliamella sp. B2776]
MKKRLIAVLIPLAINSYSFTSYALSPAPIKVKQALDVAPENGFGGYNSVTNVGTTGGSKAKQEMIFLVNNKKDLLEAIKINKDEPRIIQISGIVDISEDKPYKDFDDQKSRSLIKIPSNTTLIGVGKEAGFINGSIILSNVNNVIIRNLKIEAPIDVAPKFEEGDGWNAEWDGINIISSTYVWIDHVTLTDGKFTDNMYQKKDGWKYVQHDGLLDIKRGSNFITISYCLFENHDKTMLIGHSDKNADQDENKLNITLHHNVFLDITQRAPRVRFGKIHMYNNLFKGSVNKSKTVYPYQYSIGLGYKGSVLSENNHFMIDGLKDNCKVAKQFKGDNLRDKNSLFNQSKLKLASCGFVDNLYWSVPYQYSVDDIKQFSKNSDRLVGSGKL